MSTFVPTILISIVLGTAASGAVWFGWELMAKLASSLHAPKAPPVTPPPAVEPAPPSAAPEAPPES